MKGFKVVQVLDSKLVSAYIGTHCLLKSMTVEYKPNKWIYGKNDTSLMAFDTLENALGFFREGFGSEIWECEIEKGKEFAISTLYPKIILEWFNGTQKNKDYSHYILTLPFTGTVFCKAIKLLNKVFPNE